MTIQERVAEAQGLAKEIVKNLQRTHGLGLGPEYEAIIVMTLLEYFKAKTVELPPNLNKPFMCDESGNVFLGTDEETMMCYYYDASALGLCLVRKFTELGRPKEPLKIIDYYRMPDNIQTKYELLKAYIRKGGKIYGQSETED